MRKTLLIGILIFLSVSFFSIEKVFANIPSMLDINISEDGANFILNIEISHSNPTASHYVNSIEVELNGELEQISDLEPQTETVFTYQHDIVEPTYESLRVRAHCTPHGWSAWKNVDPIEPTTPFLLTPLGITIIIGVVIIVIVVIFKLR